MSPARSASNATVDPSDDTTSTGLPVALPIVVARIWLRMYCSVNVFAPTTMRAAPLSVAAVTNVIVAWA